MKTAFIAGEWSRRFVPGRGSAGEEAHQLKNAFVTGVNGQREPG
jgi:hypothetical protein